MDTPLPGVNIPHFGQGSYTLVVAPMGVKFGTEEGTVGPSVPSSVPNFTPIGATCRPCAAKNLKICL